MINIRRKIADYTNGNVHTIIFSDGTKIREVPDGEEFNPDFAESIDINISTKCYKECDICYEDCSKNGSFGYIMDTRWVESLHPYTEVAVNLNFPFHPQFYEFARYLKNKKIILNITVNQEHFMNYQHIIKDLYEKELINGIGISLIDPYLDFINTVKQYPNAVIHVINGIFDEYNFVKLRNNNLKLLILGYKSIGRGFVYDCINNEKLSYNKKWLKDNLFAIFYGFNIVSFDNLAIEQLDLQNNVSKEYWDCFYCGNDGENSFYIDTVKNYFSKSSIDPECYNIKNYTIDDMFNIIKNGSRKGDYQKNNEWIPVICDISEMSSLDKNNKILSLHFKNIMPEDGQEIWIFTKDDDMYHYIYKDNEYYAKQPFKENRTPWTSIIAWKPYLESELNPDPYKNND